MKFSKYLALLASALCAVSFTARAEDAPAKPEKPERPGRGERVKLTDEEKTKLKAAREAALKDPAVVKAKEALDKAEESKDRKAIQEARKAHAEAIKAAMIKADPSVADILKKMPQAPGRGEGRPGRGDRGPKEKPSDKPADKPASE